MSATFKLDRIRVQTARMVEIYALVRRELAAGHLGLPLAERQRLQRAVDTIAANMGRLALQLAPEKEDTSPGQAAPERQVHQPGLGRLDAAASQELGQIVDAVLRWQAAGPDEDAD